MPTRPAGISPTTLIPADLRCAVHPGRPAVDACPVCARPRCAVDAARGGDAAREAASGMDALGGPGSQPGCGACQPTGHPGGQVPAAPPVLVGTEPYIRAALAGTFAAVLGGLVTSEYIGAPFFAFVAPFLVGVLCGGAALRSAQTDGRGVVGGRIRAIGVGYSLLGVGVGFKVVPGGGSAFSPIHSVLLPYLCAAVGAVLWTLPPKRRGPAT